MNIHIHTLQVQITQIGLKHKQEIYEVHHSHMS